MHVSWLKGAQLGFCVIFLSAETVTPAVKMLSFYADVDEIRKYIQDSHLAQQGQLFYPYYIVVICNKTCEIRGKYLNILELSLFMLI